jgi:predicted kinase
MAKLSTEKRNSLPNSTFAGPDRSYPIPDKSHARNALGRATQQLNRGNLTIAEAEKIRAKANRKLGKHAS